MPERARIHYNLGLLLQHLKQDSDAEASLLKAQELEPDNLDYLYALADFYLKRKKLQKAKSIAEQMIAKHPTTPNRARYFEPYREKFGSEFELD